MRYRATIYVDVWVDSKKEAEDKVDKIVLGVPNSYSAEIEELPHGSEISLDAKEPKCS